MMHPDTELLMHLASNLVREYPNGVSTVDMHLRMAISLDKARKILCALPARRACWAWPVAASPLDGRHLSGRQS